MTTENDIICGECGRRKGLHRAVSHRCPVIGLGYFRPATGDELDALRDRPQGTPDIPALVAEIEKEFPDAAWLIGRVTKNPYDDPWGIGIGRVFNAQDAVNTVGLVYGVIINTGTVVAVEKSADLSVALESALKRMRVDLPAAEKGQ